MKEQNTYVEYTRSELDALPDETDWERIDAMTDEDIEAAERDDSDAMPTDEAFWQDAGVVFPENHVYVEPDVLEWFKAHAGDVSAQINAVLKDYVLAHQNA